MEDLKILLDKQSIEDINHKVDSFIQSAEQHGNKLKLTLVLLHLIDESSKLLQSIDCNEFISAIGEEVRKIDAQANSLSEEYKEHLKQNQEIREVLANSHDSQITQLQNNIKALLKEYDAAIKKLVEARDKLPIEKQMEDEKK